MKTRIWIVWLASVFALSACNDWLTVASETEITNEQQFSNQQGFQDATIGVYLNLAKPALYGKNLTWGYLEFLAQNYELVAASTYKSYFEYDYRDPGVSQTINMIWGQAYKTIANINNLLKWEKTNRNVMNPVIDSLILGEMLAVRAMLHFDLIRMHCRGNLSARPDALNDLCIPYSTEFRKETPPRYTYGETLEMIVADLRQAIAYLEVDPVNNKREKEIYEKLSFGGFLNGEAQFRQTRMNYYAAETLLARVLLWRGGEQDKREALLMLQEVYDNISGNDRLTFLTYESYFAHPTWYARDVDMNLEHVFALEVNNLRGTIGSAFNAEKISTTTLYWSKASVWERFELPELDADYRFGKCLLQEGVAMDQYSILKNRKPTEEESKSYKNRVMPIRLPEIYYMLAELYLASSEMYDREKAVEILNKIRTARSIPETKKLDAATLNDAQIMEEITKEYRKEYVGEGVLFYYYKRRGIQNIRGYQQPMTDVQYVVPLPETENNYLSK